MVSPAFLQWLLESLHNIAFLRTDFTEVRNVKKSSITVPVSDVF